MTNQTINMSTTAKMCKQTLILSYKQCIVSIKNITSSLSFSKIATHMFVLVAKS